MLGGVEAPVGGNRPTSWGNSGASAASYAERVFPFRARLRNPAPHQWPTLIFVVLVSLSSAALVIFYHNQTQSTFDDAAWISAAYFGVTWLLIKVIARRARVTQRMLAILVASGDRREGY